MLLSYVILLYVLYVPLARLFAYLSGNTCRIDDIESIRMMTLGWFLAPLTDWIWIFICTTIALDKFMPHLYKILGKIYGFKDNTEIK